MMERLAWVVLACLVLWLLKRGFFVYRLRKMQTSVQLALPGRASLIAVVSAHCAICPAQKRVISQLSALYPVLQIITLDAEQEAEQVRALSILTVPTTLLLDKDGAIAHVNHGFAKLDVLASQAEKLCLLQPKSKAGGE